MGLATALGFADAVNGGEINLDQALGYHLQVNHFPPVPGSMVAPCRKAIEAAREGDWDRLIDLPDPVTWRDQNQAPVWAIVKAHHLEAFL
ncbi:MAG TPA: hypothetical protein VF377_08980 [Acidimicrobiia bacterium]